MSDNRKYYYLKLKENYFDDDSIVLLESMQDGVLYSNVLLKLYLKSLKHGGRLQLDEDIICIGDNNEHCRALISQHIQLHLVVCHQVTQFLNVKWSQSRTAGNQNGLRRFTRDKLSRTF